MLLLCVGRRGSAEFWSLRTLYLLLILHTEIKLHFSMAAIRDSEILESSSWETIFLIV